jgi:hypothetical protein
MAILMEEQLICVAVMEVKSDGELRLDAVSSGEVLGRTRTGSLISPRRVPSDIRKDHHDIALPSATMDTGHVRAQTFFSSHCLNNRPSNT